MGITDTPLIYVAGAYSGDVASNIEKAEAVSIALIRNGWYVFTPHKNTAGYEKYDYIAPQAWLAMDLNILSRCDAMYVMDNWHGSFGTKGEILYAKRAQIPIIWEEDYPADSPMMDLLLYPCLQCQRHEAY